MSGQGIYQMEHFCAVSWRWDENKGFVHGSKSSLTAFALHGARVVHSFHEFQRGLQFCSYFSLVSGFLHFIFISKYSVQNHHDHKTAENWLKKLLQK